ncbi:hypothetical protein Tco_0760853 [Tanacetum coccineum]
MSMSKTTAWNEFSSTMASAIICLATNQKFNFSKFIFEGMIRNLDNVSGKFLMYPRNPRKDTQVPQPSDPSKNVADEAVHKELGDSLISDLEKTNTTQQNEIDSLKKRVKKLEKKRSSRTHKLKRLYKFGLIARVESSSNEEDLDDADNEMFDVNVLNGDEVFVAGQNENVVEEVVDVAQVSIVATTITITTEEITLAQALEALKTSKPSSERLQAQEQEELSDAEKATLFQQLLEKRRKHFAAKRAEEKRNKPPTQAQQRKIMCTYLKNMEEYKLKDLKLKEFDSIQKMFHRAFKRVNTFEDFRTELVEGKEKRAGKELIQESLKKQKVDDDKEQRLFNLSQSKQSLTLSTYKRRGKVAT